RGESGVDRTRNFDATTFPTNFSAEVKNYDWRKYVRDAAIHEGIGSNTSFALGAAAQARKSPGHDKFRPLDRERMGISLGSGEGSLDFDNYVASNLAGWNAEKKQVEGGAWGKAALASMTALREIEQEPNMPLSHIAMEFGAMGPAYNCLTA